MATHWWDGKANEKYWVEIRKIPGLRRSDTVKKAVASAYVLHHAAETFPPLILLASHLPVPGSAGDRMISAALEAGALSEVVCINDPGALRRLERLSKRTPDVFQLRLRPAL